MVLGERILCEMQVAEDLALFGFFSLGQLSDNCTALFYTQPHRKQDMMQCSKNIGIAPFWKHRFIDTLIGNYIDTKIHIQQL